MIAYTNITQDQNTPQFDHILNLLHKFNHYHIFTRHYLQFDHLHNEDSYVHATMSRLKMNLQISSFNSVSSSVDSTRQVPQGDNLQRRQTTRVSIKNV